MRALDLTKRYIVTMIVLQSLLAALFLANHTASTVVKNAIQTSAFERKTFQTAIEQAERRVVVTGKAILADDVFKKSIDWQTDHSLKKTLETQADSINASGISLFDTQCNPIAAVHALKRQKFPCISIASMNFVEQDDAPFIVFTREFQQNGKKFYLQTYLELSKSWVTQVAGGPLILKITGNPGLGVAYESNTTFASPTLLNALDRVEQTLVGFFLLSIMIGAVQIISRMMHVKRQINKAIVSLKNPDLLKSTDYQVLDDQLEKENELQQALITSIETNRKTLSELQTRQFQLSELNTKIRGDLHDAKQTILNLKRQNALADQINETVLFLEAAWSRITDLLKNSETLVQSTYLRAAQRINERFQYWKTAIAEKGSRKFIRSLSELESSTPGKSILDDEVDHMVAEGEIISRDMAVIVANHDELIEDFMLSQQVVDEWLLISNQLHINASDYRLTEHSFLEDVLLKSEHLTKYRHPHLLMDFNYRTQQLETESSVIHPCILSSLLCLTYNEFIKCFKDIPRIGFVTKLTQVNSQLQLTVAPSLNPKLVDLPSMHENLDLSFEKIENICIGQKIKYSYVPLISTLPVIQFSWECSSGTHRQMPPDSRAHEDRSR